MDDTGKHFGVIVGVDGSGDSNAAVRWAASEAAMRRVRLTLVHAISMPSPGWPVSELRELYTADADGILDDALTDINEFMRGDAPTDIRRQIIFSPPTAALVDMSKEADMVVVGARGLGPLRRVLLGSVSTALIHHAHSPVAVARHNASVYRQPDTAPILLGTDSSEGSELATKIAFEEASLRKVNLVALHAINDADMSHLRATRYTEALSTIGDRLNERLAPYQKQYPDVGVQRAVMDDRPTTHLLNLSATAQLVVVGSHGRGGFARLALGSVSTAVAHASRTPVIIARSD